jgi:hypothetical protein
MSLVVTPSSGGAQTFSDCVAGYTGISGDYWLGQAEPGNSKHATEKHPAPGQSGTPVKRHGFRERIIDGLLIEFIKGSADACWSAYNTAEQALAGKACSLAWGGLTLVASEVEEFTVEPIGRYGTKGPKRTGQNGMYRMRCRMRFEQLRES